MTILILGSAGVTLSYVVAFSASLRSVGGTLPFMAAAAVFLGASAVAAAAPTPGGLGALEAAMAAGAVTFHVPPPTAIASVVVFRGLTYWLPIVPGAVLFVVLRRRTLL